MSDSGLTSLIYAAGNNSNLEVFALMLQWSK